MFQENEYVVYGRIGVCMVEGVEQEEGQDYYCLRSLHQNCQIKTPVNGTVPIRKVMTREEAEALIDSIPIIQVEKLKNTSTKELHDQCKALISSQDSVALIALTMSLYEKKQKDQKINKKLSSTEEMFLKEGESLLFGELSVALGIPFNGVPKYVRNRVQGKRFTSDW